MANETNENLIKRDEKRKEVDDLYKQLSEAHYEAMKAERSYIEDELIKHGIAVGLTRVKYKATGEIGVIKIVSAGGTSQVGMISGLFGRSFTSLANNLHYYEAEFRPLTKRGEPSERASKTRTYRNTGTIDNFASYFEVADLKF